jgi:hypothetical protein
MSVAANLTPDQSQQVIYNAARNNGLPDAISKIITAQSGHETGGWDSNVYLTDNNAFGYGYDGAGNYYAYNSVEDSVQDVVGWLSRHVPNFQTITDPDVYAQSLKNSGYYGDTETNYAAGIERWFNDNLTYTTAGIGVAAIVGIILLFIVFRKN